MLQSDPHKKTFEIYPQTLSGFNIHGVSHIIESGHENASTAMNAAWQDFFRSGLINSPDIPEDGHKFYAVYSDYQGGQEKPFKLTIGYKPVTDSRENDYRTVSIESGTYAIFAAQGPQPKALLQTWQYIWQSDLKRTFKTDFEVYGPRYFQNGLNEILVCVGIEP